jgi:ABC-type nitrate/sulfonate/bicarbonate transport system substrate-binding protein
MRKKGLRLNLIRPDDYGIRFYSDTLATTEKIIAERPELITRFLRASLKGWQEAVEDYQKAVEITLKYTRTKDAELQNAMMEAMLPLVHTGEDYLGWMTPEMWKSMVEVMSEQGLLARPLDSGEPYNLRFLKEVYRVGSQ